MNEAERYLKERLRQQHPSAQKEPDLTPIPSGPQRMVSMGTAWKYFWTRWTFQGRASRSEFWWAILANFLAFLMLGAVIGFLLGIGGASDRTLDAIVAGLDWVVRIATFIPGTCLTVRRLHDTNHAWGWWFLVFVPIVGWIVLLVLLCMKSDSSSNRYGPVPNTEA